MKKRIACLVLFLSLISLVVADLTIPSPPPAPQSVQNNQEVIPVENASIPIDDVPINNTSKLVLFIIFLTLLALILFLIRKIKYKK